MREYSRKPTSLERAIAVVVSGVLTALFGSLAAFLAYRSFWLAAAIFGALFAGLATLLYRAALGTPRALRRNESRLVAWGLLVTGIAGVALVLLIKGSTSHRLLVLGPALTFIAAGAGGIRSRG